MYISSSAPALRTREQESLCLHNVHMEATLEDLLCTTRIKQTWQNTTRKNIEAVYTFPLPLDGVLLDLTVRMKDRTLRGQAVEKKQAEEAYEDAIVQGDTAIMLERSGSGLYTMNVGNLAAEETVHIEITFAEFLVWRGDRVTYTLPTTLAPRYGDPEDAGLQPHQVPETDAFLVRNFSLRMNIHGMLTGARIVSPSHSLKDHVSGDQRILTLDNTTEPMDRDLLIHFQKDPQDYALCARDQDRFVVLLACVPLPSSQQHPGLGRSIKIVVDCSGSMHGDAISQAREAVFRIIDTLEEEDHFSIVRFGSSVDRVSGGTTLCASHENKQKMLARLENMQADLGGTEMANALDAALGIVSPEGMKQDVLLITDGEVWHEKSVYRMVKNRTHRIFCVGVGSAVARGMLRTVSRMTGGEATFVAPTDDMNRAVCTQYKRMTARPARDISLNFQEHFSVEQSPDPLPVIFPGDTMLVFSWFDRCPDGDCLLDVIDGEGQPFFRTTPIRMLPQGTDLLPRMAAQHRIDSGVLEAGDAVELAVSYNLVSNGTNYLVVDERKQGEDGVVDLPHLVSVPQMLPAGWGGHGTVSTSLLASHEMYDIEPPEISYCRVRRPADTEQKFESAPPLGEDFFLDTGSEIGFFDLESLVPREVLRSLEDLVDEEWSEEMITNCFLSILLAAHPSLLTDRQRVREVRRYMHWNTIDAELMARCTALVEKMDYAEEGATATPPSL